MKELRAFLFRASGVELEAPRVCLGGFDFAARKDPGLKKLKLVFFGRGLMYPKSSSLPIGLLS